MQGEHGRGRVPSFATMRIVVERRTQEQEENKGGAQPGLLIETRAPCPLFPAGATNHRCWWCRQGGPDGLLAVRCASRGGGRSSTVAGLTGTEESSVGDTWCLLHASKMRRANKPHGPCQNMGDCSGFYGTGQPDRARQRCHAEPGQEQQVGWRAQKSRQSETKQRGRWRHVDTRSGTGASKCLQGCVQTTQCSTLW